MKPPADYGEYTPRPVSRHPRRCSRGNYDAISRALSRWRNILIFTCSWRSCRYFKPLATKVTWRTRSRRYSISRCRLAAAARLWKRRWRLIEASKKAALGELSVGQEKRRVGRDASGLRESGPENRFEPIA